MNSNNENENELELKVKELQKREQLLRLRELEAEIQDQRKEQQRQQQYQEPPFYPTRKDNPPENRLSRWKKKLGNVAKFLGFAIAVFVTVRIAYGLSIMIMVTGIVWISYKIFLEKKDSE